MEESRNFRERLCGSRRKLFSPNVSDRPRAVVDQPARKRTFSGLLDALRERGYVEGRNIVIEYRSAEGTAYLVLSRADA